ncbi:hypothetical protein [Leeuwenhoekiella parthenopeia]|uniref:Uncharacterized protein n=1 Tax=Leeuwenhoekiella parthenopeia TaxID=2890320 RepID=A0ABS8GWB0_9FLAO|nr:hypothetical protein [Leeuwenhoekiella parthenopeia]MCC4213763.1 hypothetical protein [Leeuwenhoekiella parthenopeia]
MKINLLKINVAQNQAIFLLKLPVKGLYDLKNHAQIFWPKFKGMQANKKLSLLGLSFIL